MKLAHKIGSVMKGEYKSKGRSVGLEFGSSSNGEGMVKNSKHKLDLKKHIAEKMANNHFKELKQAGIPTFIKGKKVI